MLHAAETINIKKTFTKSDYIPFIKCTEVYWLAIHKSEFKVRLTEDALHSTEQGQNVPLLTQQLFSSQPFLVQNNLHLGKVTSQKKIIANDFVAIADTFIEFKNGKISLSEDKVETELTNDIISQKIVSNDCKWATLARGKVLDEIKKI